MKDLATMISIKRNDSSKLPRLQTFAQGFILVLLGLFVRVDGAFAQRAEQDKDLSPALRRQVDAGLKTAWENQAWGSVFEQAAGILQRGGPSAVNSYLKTVQMPASEELLATAWLRLGQNDMPVPLRLPAQGEACVAILEGVRTKLRQATEDSETSLAGFRNRLRETDLDALEDVQWELLAAARLGEQHAAACDAALHLLGQANKVNKRVLADEQRVAIREDLQETGKLLDEIHGRISAVGDELRVARLDLIVREMERTNPASRDGLKMRFRAAFALEQDGPDLKRISETVANSGHDGTDVHVQAQMVRQLLTRAESGLAPEFRALAKNAHEGLAWWKRGRYGEGAEFQGLLKHEGALGNSAQMVMLEMPRERIRPVDPLASGTFPRPSGEVVVPRYARRHFFLWQITARGMVKTVKPVFGTKYVESSEPVGFC
jgi:hypothetical protein